MICLFVCLLFFYVKAFAILYLHNYSHANKAYVVVVVVLPGEGIFESFFAPRGDI